MGVLGDVIGKASSGGGGGGPTRSSTENSTTLLLLLLSSFIVTGSGDRTADTLDSVDSVIDTNVVSASRGEEITCDTGVVVAIVGAPEYNEETTDAAPTGERDRSTIGSGGSVIKG